MFEQDYIMRLISEIVRTILKLVFHIDAGQPELEEEEVKEEEVKEEYGKLVDLIEGGKINEAENRLLEELDDKNQEQFKMALLFYLYLNEKDNDFLEEHNYKREEIAEGLRYVSKVYGCAGLTEVFLDGN